MSGQGRVRAADWTGRDNQLWSRSWDNCLENKQTGQVLHFDGERLGMVEVAGAGSREQRWRLTDKGRLVHKASGKLLCLEDEERGRLGLRPFLQAERQEWRFRCLDEIRRTDSFVQYTPWHNMISWE